MTRPASSVPNYFFARPGASITVSNMVRDV
jgi:hypothetical protein